MEGRGRRVTGSEGPACRDRKGARCLLGDSGLRGGEQGFPPSAGEAALGPAGVRVWWRARVWGGCPAPARSRSGDWSKS